MKRILATAALVAAFAAPAFAATPDEITASVYALGAEVAQENSCQAILVGIARGVAETGLTEPEAITTLAFAGDPLAHALAILGAAYALKGCEQ